MGSIVCQRTFTGCASSSDFKSYYSRTMHIFKPISFLASSLCWQARGPRGTCLIKWINHGGGGWLISPCCLQRVSCLSHCALIFFHPSVIVILSYRPKKLTLKGYKQYWCTFKDITISCYKSKEEAHGTPAHQMNLRGEATQSASRL